MPRSLADAGLTDGDRRLLTDINQIGWHVVMIPEEQGTPGWAYSVGLFQSFRHPEVITFGLPINVASSVVNEIGYAASVGRGVAAGVVSSDILDGLNCTFRPVLPKWYRPFLGYGNWYYQGTDYLCLQCFWPDKAGYFPWDAHFNKSWQRLQPLLYEPDPVAARLGPLLQSLGDS